jgi:hypothetical protein
MSRYATSQILKSIGKPRKLSSIIIPVIPVSESDTFIETSSEERLDKLANTFYGDATLWWAIAVSNGIGKGTLIVPQNSTLRIPSIENIQQIINQTNQSR